MSGASTEYERGGRAFPKTRWSVVLDASDPESPTRRVSLESLADTYWRCIYGYFRRKWNKSNEEAKDLTQNFFAWLFERDAGAPFASVDGRFRAYVMATLDNFVRMDHRRNAALKRGGRVLHFSSDAGEGLEPAAAETPEEAFLQDWRESVLDKALEELEREYQAAGRESDFQIFLLREVDRPPGADLGHEELARRFGLEVARVRSILYEARDRLRETIWGVVRESVTSNEEARAEMQDLLGMSSP